MKREKQNFKRKIGFFGGTFDPIHIGHLTLAIEIQEKRKLDIIYFCPAHLSPFKQKTPPHASDNDRLRMVQLAIQEIPSFTLLSTEIERGSISYTVDTLEELAHREKGKLFFLLAKDAVGSLNRWKDIKKILSLASPLVGVHPEWDQEKLAHLPSFIRYPIEKGMTPISTVEISSTFIRQRFKKGLYCGHLLPRKVLDYVDENHLYST